MWVWIYFIHFSRARIFQKNFILVSTCTREFPNSCNQRLTDGLGAYHPDIPRPHPDDRCSSRRSRNRSPCHNKLGCPCPCPWSPGRWARNCPSRHHKARRRAGNWRICKWRWEFASIVQSIAQTNAAGSFLIQSQAPLISDILWIITIEILHLTVIYYITLL